eukprot:TRINITY_DN73896_c0_g1_i1.p1 TRINITY_DN73896_c0_g1~~TRINITY_DN73896_c0_g1_i1.p1  ORF type:complete len:425 (+),score=143.07 TRINITY_DN73896_c0_g1_i1:74-1348(+)
MQLMTDFATDSFLGTFALFMCGVFGWVVTKWVNCHYAKVVGGKLHIKKECEKVETGSNQQMTELSTVASTASASPATPSADARRRQRRRAAAAAAKAARAAEGEALKAADALDEKLADNAQDEIIVEKAAEPEAEAETDGGSVASVASLLVAYDLFECVSESKTPSPVQTPMIPAEDECWELEGASIDDDCVEMASAEATVKTTLEEAEEASAALQSSCSSTEEAEAEPEPPSDCEGCEDFLGIDTGSESGDYSSPPLAPMPSACLQAPLSPLPLQQLWDGSPGLVCASDAQVPPLLLPPSSPEAVWSPGVIGDQAFISGGPPQFFEFGCTGDGQDLYTDGKQVYAMMQVPIAAGPPEGELYDYGYGFGPGDGPAGAAGAFCFGLDLGLGAALGDSRQQEEAAAEDLEWNTCWDFEPKPYEPSQ